jgi:predicted outer membrane repeat protein
LKDDTVDIFVSPQGNDNWNGKCREHEGGENGPKKTIGNALKNLKNNGIILILTGTYCEHDLIINKDVHLFGEDDVNIDAQHKGRIISINNPKCKVEIARIIFKNGNTNPNENGGAILINGARVIIIGCTFSLNMGKTNGCGGAIYNNKGTVMMARSQFSNNSAGLYGGAICNTGVLEIYTTMFIRNHAINGGSIATYAEKYVDGGENIFEENTPNDIYELDKHLFCG